MGVCAYDDVDARNRCSQLLVGQVAGVPDGHDDVDSISLELAHLLLESLDLIVELKSCWHIGRPDGFRGEITHETDLSSTFLNNKRFLCKAVKLWNIPAKKGVYRTPLLRTSILFLRSVHVRNNHGDSFVPQEWLQSLSPVVKLMVTESHCIEI